MKQEFKKLEKSKAAYMAALAECDALAERIGRAQRRLEVLSARRTALYIEAEQDAQALKQALSA